MRSYSIHLSTAKTWRGGENQIWLLARGLIRRGQRVLVLAPPDAPLLERCAKAGIPARELKLRSQLDLLGSYRLSRLLKREGANVLHLHDGHALLPGLLAAKTIPKKSLKVVAHRRTAFDVRGSWKYRGRADRVIAISDAVRQKLIEAGVEDSRIAVVYSGIEFGDDLSPDDPSVEKMRQKFEIPRGAFVIVHAAALTEEKRQCDIIAALAKLDDSSVHLALAGSGVLEQNLRAQAAALGVQDRVHFAGFIGDLRPFWALGSAVVFASSAEGLCTALIEAQGAGLPAVATRAGGMVEVVDDGKTGFLADIGSVEQISEQLRTIIKDKKLQAKLGNNARARARARFSADAMVDGILKVYGE